jgi:hypothetical protein
MSDMPSAVPNPPNISLIFILDNIPSYLKPKPSIPWSVKAMVNGSEDTPRTEDFENNFSKMNVKHVAGVPLTSFDDMIIDSDLDTVRSSQVRDRLRGFPGKYHLFSCVVLE